MAIQMGVQNLETELEQLVETVRNRLQETDSVLKTRTDFEFLAKFIRVKEYNVEAAICSIQRYYNGIQSNLDKLEGITAAQFESVYKSGPVRHLKGRINNVPMLCFSIDLWDPRKVSLETLMLSSVFVFEEDIKNPMFQIHGGVAIIDLSGFSFGHVRELTYKHLMFLMKYSLRTYPLRVAGIHFVNTPSIFWPIYTMVLKFLPRKIRDRIKFHSDTKTLLDFISPELLPKHLGGLMEGDEAWDNSVLLNLMQQNPCYDSYWKPANAKE